MRNSLVAFAGAAALAMSLAAAAPAQHAPPAQQDTAPMTQAQIDAEAVRYGAGGKRLKEVLAALNSGDYATIRAYFEGQSDKNGLSNALSRYHLSRGYDLMRVTTEPNRGDVVGIVRNRITGDEEYLAFKVEPQPPRRITLFSAAVAPEVVAIWKLRVAASKAVTQRILRVLRPSETSGLDRK